MTDSEKGATHSQPPREAANTETAGEQSSIFDKVMRDGVVKGLEGFIREGKLKNIVGELKMPKEIVAHIIAQVDETKSAAVGIIGKEVRLFLEHTNLSDELARLLTQISLQIKTEIRFIPNDEAVKDTNRKKKKKGLDIRTSFWPKRVSETPPPEEVDDDAES